MTGEFDLKSIVYCDNAVLLLMHTSQFLFYLQKTETSDVLFFCWLISENIEADLSENNTSVVDLVLMLHINKKHETEAKLFPIIDSLWKPVKQYNSEAISIFCKIGQQCH